MTYCTADARSRDPKVTNLNTGGHSTCLNVLNDDDTCPNRHNHHDVWINLRFRYANKGICAGCGKAFRNGACEKSVYGFSWHPACQRDLPDGISAMADGTGVLTTTYYA